MNFDRLNELKAKLDGLRPLPDAAVRNLHENLVLQWTYNSNAIEGNTLSLMETKVALEGITVGGKTLREHFEVINHREAIFFVEEIVSANTPLSEWHIKSLHQLILKNIDDTNAGKYRSINVLISGAQHVPPDYIHVSDEMAGFISWYQKSASDMHPVELAARAHCDFVKIHPFVDGNGRTSRLLMNVELMKAGYPAAVIPVNRRLEYYSFLDKAHTSGEYEPFIRLIAEIAEQSFEPYWHALGIK
ncbi:Fic family protein [Desulforegula conservatrix]|uniref:Fic family protein n=1 Tax=Desulforegula conservatrix TaxID=153026 RepID=UPI00041F652F|nr:Fic family protein [Desulforegula conservatrix]